MKKSAHFLYHVHFLPKVKYVYNFDWRLGCVLSNDVFDKPIGDKIIQVVTKLFMSMIVLWHAPFNFTKCITQLYKRIQQKQLRYFGNPTNFDMPASILLLYCDERRGIRWNVAWAQEKSRGRSPRDFPRAQAIFHRILLRALGKLYWTNIFSYCQFEDSAMAALKVH